jgi:hypothetical protein
VGLYIATYWIPTSLLHNVQQLRLSQSPKQSPMTGFRQSLIFVQIYITSATILNVRRCNTSSHDCSGTLRNILGELSTLSRYQWQRGLRRRSSAARLLRYWVRIPLGTWMLVVCVVCCQVEVSATGWEYYRLWCVVLCDLDTSWMGYPWPTRGCWATPPPKKNSPMGNTVRNSLRMETGIGNWASNFLCVLRSYTS